MGGYDFGNFDSNPGLDCSAQTHGTATTGVAVGNGGGVTGTAPGAKVVFLKVQRAVECGTGALGGDIVGALDWIVTNRLTYGIRVVSMSLGAGPYSSVSACDASHTAMRNSINAAYAAGLVLVAAAGNDAQTAAISRPACFANVISVGAVYDATISRSYAICSDFLAPADRVTCYSNSTSSSTSGHRRSVP